MSTAKPETHDRENAEMEEGLAEELQQKATLEGSERETEEGEHEETPQRQEYRLKTIDWVDQKTGHPMTVKILTQNENGPCPLIAVCNVLLLRGDIFIGPEDRRMISFTELVDILGDYILQKMSSSEEASGMIACLSNYGYSLNEVFALIPTLQTGLDVNVKFSNINAFEPTSGLSLFDILNVDIVHGWVVDPEQRHVYDVVVKECGNYNTAIEYALKSGGIGSMPESSQTSNHPSYDQVEGTTTNGTHKADDEVTKGLIVGQFLEETSSQLTSYGLQLLIDCLQDNQLSVLFRNNHFSTIYNHAATQTIYMLLTDSVFVGERRFVWESLRDVNQKDSEFVDGYFGPASEADGGDWTVDAAEQQPYDEETRRDFEFAQQLQREEDARSRAAERRHARPLQESGSNTPSTIEDRLERNAKPKAKKGTDKDCCIQ
ncbi:hypothetical protein BZG36_03416 [Bifiguratus adelaidae]|uniref:MINDY deubiquitinase domain-containing protein n=1 Tax=Bifiguratus adelaidae TaxID=1938954 RepID=A0A261XYT9_9FUNG|nr:hypothetical protein BZG36_03416 [Bifiguratus adelaidae]